MESMFINTMLDSRGGRPLVSIAAVTSPRVGPRLPNASCSADLRRSAQRPARFVNILAEIAGGVTLYGHPRKRVRR